MYKLKRVAIGLLFLIQSVIQYSRIQDPAITIDVFYEIRKQFQAWNLRVIWSLVYRPNEQIFTKQR